jgi:HEAT repeat protein
MALDDVFRHVETLKGSAWDEVQRLAVSGDQSLVGPVQAALERYLDEENFVGRDLMAMILAGLRGTAAFPLLLRAFARRFSFDHRNSFCALLGDVMDADPAGCRPTVHSFINSGRPDLQRAGLWALGYVIEPDDFEVLRPWTADPDRDVRQTALGSLASLRGDQRAYEVTVAALRDPDVVVRHSAVLHMRSFTALGPVDNLLALTSDPAPLVRSAVGEIMGNLPIVPDRRPAVVEALSLLLADSEPRVRAGAARGLAALSGP